jgi:hypothetical protein
MNVRRVILFGSLLFLPLQALSAQNVCVTHNLVSVKVAAKTATAIHGTVQYQAGAQAKSVVMTLSRTENNPKLLQTVATDKQGQFHFDSVPEGRYFIQIYGTAGTAQPTELQCDANGVCAVAFTLKPPSLSLARDCPRTIMTPSFEELQQPAMRGSTTPAK